MYFKKLTILKLMNTTSADVIDTARNTLATVNQVLVRKKTIWQGEP